jgi:hypothetical protein
MAASTVICIWTYKRSWFWPVALASFYVVCLSISLGWHYAIDGIVGAAIAAGLYGLLLALIRQSFSEPNLASEGSPSAKNGENIIPQ